MVVSLNYCAQNGGNLYRAPYYNGNPTMGPRIIRNLDQYPRVVKVGGLILARGGYKKPLEGANTG